MKTDKRHALLIVISLGFAASGVGFAASAAPPAEDPPKKKQQEGGGEEQKPGQVKLTKEMLERLQKGGGTLSMSELRKMGVDVKSSADLSPEELKRLMESGQTLNISKTAPFERSLPSGDPSNPGYWDERFPRVGDAAPPLTVETIYDASEGLPAALPASWSEWRGKTIVLEFSASWCGPCIALIPHMNELADELAEEIERGEVVFLTVSNESEERVAAFREAHEMRSLFGRDVDGSTFEDYWVNGIPHVAIISPVGEIAALTHPSLVTASAVRQVIAGEAIDLPLSNESPVRQSWSQWSEAAADKADTDAETAKAFGVQIREIDVRSPMTRRDPKTGVFSAPGLSLKSLIFMAYGYASKDVSYEIEIDENKYYEVTVTPMDGEVDTSMRMLRASLESMFGFAVEAQTSVAPVKLLRRLDDAPALTPSTRDGRMGSASPGNYAMQGVRVADFAGWLHRISSKPVVDDTGVDGVYDITLTWDLLGGPESFQQALRELGFELVDGERPVKRSVIKPAP